MTVAEVLGKRSVLIGIGTTAIVAIGLGVGLGVGLKTSDAAAHMSCHFEHHVEMVAENETYYEYKDFKKHIEYSQPLWVNPEEQHITCVDVRNADYMIGTPGGETSEFILGIYQKILANGGVDPAVLDTALENYVITELKAYINKFCTEQRPFFYHTAQDKLLLALKNMSSTAVPEIKPAATDIEKWLDELSEPHAQGCGHLKYMMYETADYKIPYALIKTVIKTIYRLWWDDKYSPKMLIHNYQFLLKPKGVLVVVPEAHGGESNECTIQQPLLKPTIKAETIEQKSIFIYHAHYIEEFRAARSAYWTPSKAEETLKAINTIAEVQLEHTLHHLAYGMPVAQMKYHSELQAHEAAAEGEAAPAAGGH